MACLIKTSQGEQSHFPLTRWPHGPGPEWRQQQRRSPKFCPPYPGHRLKQGAWARERGQELERTQDQPRQRAASRRGEAEQRLFGPGAQRRKVAGQPRELRQMERLLPGRQREWLKAREF